MLKYTNSKSHLLIFSPPRSGSSMLRSIVINLLNANIAYEPFAYCKVLQTKNIYDNLLALSKNSKGIKHVTFKHFPYNLPEEQVVRYNKILIKQFEKIIFLLRKDTFQTALSMEISKQINNWNFGVTFQNEKFYFKDECVKDNSLSPVCINDFKEKIDLLNQFENIYIESIRKKNYLKVYYEDLIDGSNQSVVKIAKFLDVDFLESVMKFTDSKFKTNSQETYNLIPNFKELQSQFKS